MTETPRGGPGPDDEWRAASPPQGYGYARPSLNESEARTWAMLSHLGALLAALATGGGLAWAVPLLVMLTKGKQSEFVRNQAVESLNFQITVIIAAVASVPLILLFGLGLLTLLIVAVAALVFPIIASVAANRGDRYRYPVSLRLVH